jgi:signal transduction histidine kinase
MIVVRVALSSLPRAVFLLGTALFVLCVAGTLIALGVFFWYDTDFWNYFSVRPVLQVAAALLSGFVVSSGLLFPGEEFSSADRSLPEDLARQAEVAVHAVRLTVDLQHSRERLVATREEERRRLRRDLHDGLGAQLAGLNVQAGTLRRLIPHDPTAADELVVELREELREAIADIRRLVYDLRPPALDDLGLAESLRRLAERYGSNGEQLHVLVEAPKALPNLPAAVYRITQEALTNVARHARARRCVVRLVVNERVELEIVDDGVGIPAERSAGVGLSSMRERAAELGGTCVVESVPKGGTRVLVRLPLAKEE